MEEQIIQMIPRYFPGEKEAIARVLEAGAQHGYGNMIQRLSEECSKMLQEKCGLPKDAADRLAFDPKALLKYSEQAAYARIARLQEEVKASRWRDEVCRCHRGGCAGCDKRISDARAAVDQHKDLEPQ